jgi:hypothetical protein
MILVVLLLLAGATPAALSASRVPAADLDEVRSIVTDGQLKTWLRTWQRRLKLMDWEVEVRLVPASELKPDTLGNLRWNSDSRKALIRIMDPGDYDLPAAQIPRDIEMTILHELIHLQLSSLPRDPNRRIEEERVVCRLAEALMSLERERESAAAATPPITPTTSGAPVRAEADRSSRD